VEPPGQSQGNDSLKGSTGKVSKGNAFKGKVSEGKVSGKSLFGNVSKGKYSGKGSMGKGKQKITTGYIIGHTVSCSRDSTTPSASSQAGA
jgi:transcription initiation factor TFIID subunit TAF12